MNENPKKKEADEIRERRAQACATELDGVLQKHNCEFRPFAYITADGRILANLAIVAKEE